MKNLSLINWLRFRACLSCGREFRCIYQNCPSCGAKSGRSEITEINVPFRELIIDGLEVYTTHINEYGKIDFGGWNYSLHKNSNPELILAVQPYSQEIYCVSKALFIGYSLWDEGIKKYDDWCKQLRQQLSLEDLWATKVSTRWLYEFVRRGSEEPVSNESEADERQVLKKRLNSKQKISTLFGVGIILIMLAVPPWMARNGRPRGYYFILTPPQLVSVIDITRLLIQCAFVVLLTGGVVYALQDGNSKK